MLPQIAQALRHAVACQVTRRGTQNPGVFRRHRQGHHPGIFRRAIAQGEIDRLLEHVRRAVGHAQIEQKIAFLDRITRQKILDPGNQAATRQVAWHAQADRAAQAIRRLIADCGLARGNRANDFAGMRQQAFAGLGKAHAPCRALEQTLPYPRLQALDDGARHHRRHPQPTRSHRKAPGFGRSNEYLQIVEAIYFHQFN
ncbi:hypothetical protein SDC9_146918 [bioreactor metagenome]|uniref:Uncharacterized protein n=1 Tax=bioreactor metagenome TaxID=1076179 RepID=A0A645ECF8_9ZZZZ